MAGTAVSPIVTVPPEATCFWTVKPCPTEPVTPSVEGRARERTPESSNASWTPTIIALIAPSSGSRSYMIRQITPTANSETASGMKTAILKAVAHQTRSVSTAKTSPTAVTAAGTIRTQRALFLIAVKMISSLNIVS